MTLRLYYHPFAAFCQKVLVALYEKALPFEGELIDLGDPADRARLEAVWPLVKFPVLTDEDRDNTLAESSVIIEYLDGLGGPPLIPADPVEALRNRQWDRVIDNQVSMQLTKIVTDRLRPEEQRDHLGVSQAVDGIGKAYALLDRALGDGSWFGGAAFSLADCAAAPALFYANTVVPLDTHRPLRAYFDRLLARPSFARVVEEARPYRSLFPLPWPASYG